MMKIFIKGLNSCVMRKQKLKQYTDYLLANEHQIISKPDKAAYILLWTCAFRQDVFDNSINELLRYKEIYPAKLLIVGCLPDISPKALSIFPQENIIPWKSDVKLENIFGNNKLLKNFSEPYIEKALCKDATEYRKQHPDKDVIFHDQFIKLVISEGCNFNCTYCSEKLMFPPHKSIPINKLYNALSGIINKNGKNDVVLCADSLGDYGLDINSSLPELIEELSKLKVRFALNNFNPSSFLKYWWQLIQFIQNKTIIHLNLPIQSASDKILKLMGRTYTKDNISFIFYILNELQAKFDTHIIVGFPGETEYDFDETIDFIIQYHPKYVLASTFMEIPEMPAAKLQNKVPMDIIKNRLIRLTERLKTESIICNTDNSQLIIDRIRKLNKV